jgi:beta-lactamase regulating signal transducer with metallopeptidase domain
MTAIAQAISAALLHFVWQGLAMAFLLWVLLAILGRSPARLRYAVSCAALAAVSALPFITACVVYQASGARNPRTELATSIASSAGPAAFSDPGFLTHWLAAVEAWALPVWVAGVLIFAIRLIWSSRHITKLQRDGEPAAPAFVETISHLARKMGIVRPLRVLTSRLADTPSVVGWLKPAILLPPAALMNLSTSQLEAVLAHELAHIRRHDYLVNLLQTIIETLFFYQPAIWWISSRIRNERELCCDDVAVEICGDPVSYARALTQLEKLRLTSPELAMTSTAEPLIYRIQRLTGVAGHRPVSRVPAFLAAGLAISSFVLNVDWAKAQPQNRTEAELHRDAIWVETVKYGDLQIMVRALGTLITSNTAELNVAATQANLVKTGQIASIELRRGIIIAGEVARIDSYAVNGTLRITVELKAPVPEFVSQEIDGTIQVKTLNDVVYVGRPSVGQTGSESTLFKIEPDGQRATRVKVRFGEASTNKLQVLEGLRPGDKVILSDMSKYDGYDRVRFQ